MHIIHINSYYITRPLHSSLVAEIDKYADSQIIYIPICNNKYDDKYKIEGLRHSEYYYSKCFSQFMRYLWPVKIYKIWKDFDFFFNKFKEQKFVIHAHSLFVNGIIAYFVNKKYGNKYVVTIRNTDINTFIKKSIVFRFLGFIILKNASSITLLSPAYLRKTIPDIFGISNFQIIKDKIRVIPNGVDNFWQGHRNIHKKPDNPLVLLYVGEINKNKNIRTLIETCKLLNEEGTLSTINIVGDGPLLDTLKKLHINFKISFFGKIDDKNTLKEIYMKSDILIVPSIRESFGLVYVEAMTQGLPIIYSANQGFDGFFTEGYVGYSVDPLNNKDIATKIKKIVKNYEIISNNAYNESEKFSWDCSAQKLISLYNNIS